MNRNLTNIIRVVLDECLPRVLRDNKFFMYPFFVAAYGKFDVRAEMNFKQNSLEMDNNDYKLFYGGLVKSISRRRLTDLNTQSINKILESTKSYRGKVLDVGCGNGYLSKSLLDKCSFDLICGADAYDGGFYHEKYKYINGFLPMLPFQDREFDVTLCTHVIEHLPELNESVEELMRVTKSLLILVFPKQVYYKYTLDEHINFFPDLYSVKRIFGRYNPKIEVASGDWIVSIERGGAVA